MGDGNGPKIIGRDVLGRSVRDYSSVEWWGVPRRDIPWYPRILYDRCIGCGVCLITCGGRTVYDWDFDRMKPIVARPYNCMVGCDTCAKMCPRDAIVFPALGELRALRDRAKVVAKARKRLGELRNRARIEKPSVRT